MFPETLQYPVNQFAMLLDIVRENEDVVQIHDDVPLVDQITQDLVHHALEGGRGVAETEKHDGWFEKSSVGPESRLPFTTFSHPDIVVAPSYVQGSEVLGFLQLVDEF